MDQARIMHDKCVICGAECKHEPSGRINEDRNTVGSVRSGGGIITIGFGYGSSHDTGYYNGVICDSCAKTLVETSAEPWGTYGPLRACFKNTVEFPEDD
jgi:hypothetical protein